MKHDLSVSSLNEIAKKWVREDIVSTRRFRPLYYIHRVYETRLFGSDFFIWSFYTGFLCCITLIFFYLGMRNLKFRVSESVIFLIISFIGPQSAIWWRLGPAETLGVVFLSLSFYFMSRSLAKRNYQLNTLFFIFFLILSSLTKESFLIIIPAMVFFKIWNENIYIWSSLRESAKKNTLLIIPIAVFLIELIIIKFYLGTDYSGIDSNILNTIKGIFKTFIRFLHTYLNLLIVALLMIFINYRLKRPFFKVDRFSVAFFLLILIPNILLFAKSGLVERYLIPASIGLGFLVVSLVKCIEEDPRWFKKMTIVLIVIAYIPFIVTSFNDATAFAKEGISTNKLLSAISSNYRKGDQTLVVVNPVLEYERSVSMKTYLFYEKNIDLYGYPLIISNDTLNYPDLVGGWKSYFQDKRFENMTSKPGLLIFLDNKIIDEFFILSKLLQQDYLPIGIGYSGFALLRKK
jgi:ABC-type cobalt transport system substrate-binding protein